MKMIVWHGLLALYHALLARTGISGHSRRLSQYHRARALPRWGVSVTTVCSCEAKAEVTIFIPNFNHAEYLPAAIDSAVDAARGNTRFRTEVIVFDDCSTDNSLEIASRIGRESGVAFRILRPVWNVGLTKARNIGLRNANGTYVFFLDADNTMTADGLGALHARAREEGADAAYGPIRRIVGKGRQEGFLSDHHFDEAILRNRGNYIDAMALFRTSSLLRVGGYDIELLRLIGGHEDHDVWLRLAETGARVCYCPETVIGDYLDKNNSMAKSISQREYADGYRYMGTSIPAEPGQRNNQLVFDLGFHMGEDSSHYLASGFEVVAVEADPALHEAGTKRFSASIASGELTLTWAAAVGWRQRQTADTVAFHPHEENSLWGTASPAYRDRNTEFHGKPHASPVDVPATSLERLVATHGCPFFLKVDIEGLDTDVVNDLERLAVLPAYVSWETGKQNLAKVIASHLRLRRLGYRNFRVVQQTKVHRQLRPKDASGDLEPFPEQSSGPMPFRHPSPWHGVVFVLLQYVLLFAVYRIAGPGSLLWRAERHSSPRIHTLPRKFRSFLARWSSPFPGWFDSHAALSAPE